MIHKIAIMNDRTVQMRLRIVGMNDKPWEGNSYLIQPAELKIVEIELPEGTFPYLKIWETGQAFLSGIDAK